ncbi:transglycosylase SLT domain-containing protein [Kitasatospora sp. NPDC048343]|uniref:transglycosylase SLT domain-containing protein n=1 Tax=Kitasatospora sp. NPDC048343 TaxID=3154717 RepID=UPI0033F85613
MTTLTLQQAAAYARGAGFHGDALVDIVAVATPESSLRTDAVNAASGAVGIWQINQPVHVQDHPSWTKQWLMDPINNAAAAKVIYDQQGMGAWEAWTSGAAKPYMAAAQQAVQSVGGGSSGGSTAPDPTQAGAFDWLPGYDIAKGGSDSSAGITGIFKAVASIASLLISTAGWIADPRNWSRLIWVVVGGGIILVGLQKAGVPLTDAYSTVKKITP